MKVYIVTMEGIYRHNIVGVFSSLEAARLKAIEEIKSERDDYHTFDVGVADIDTDIDDVDPILTVKREDTVFELDMDLGRKVWKKLTEPKITIREN